MHKEVDGIKVVGFSLAGEESVVALPEYNVCFDVGRAPREIISIDNVCLTHGHMDHAAGIAYYFSQRGFLGNSPGRLIVHHSLAPLIEDLMKTWARIEGHPSEIEVVPVEPMQDVPIRRGLIVRPFAVNHVRTSLGFSVIEIRHKLKAEFHGKTGPELVALKKDGVEIEERTECPMATFTGDTALGRFLHHDFVRQSRVLIVECTFFESEHEVRARAGRHIHAEDLPEILACVPEAQILLVHLSRRTDFRTAKKTLLELVKPDDVERITFLMERPPRPQRGGDGGSERSRRTPSATSPAEPG